KAGLYQSVEIHRWSNSFQKRAADYRRKGQQQFLCTGPKTGTPEFFRQHLHAHESYFASYGDSFIFRGPIRSADGADNIGTALLRTGSGTRSRSPGTVATSATRASYGGCSGIERRRAARVEWLDFLASRTPRGPPCSDQGKTGNLQYRRPRRRPDVAVIERLFRCGSWNPRWFA